MFSIKIHNKRENRDQNFKNTVSNISKYIFGKLNFKNPKIITDNSCVEIISGQELIDSDSSENIVVELLIRKHFVINKEDLGDRGKLDKHISTIKHFCEQAKKIEDLKYLPINMR